MIEIVVFMEETTRYVAERHYIQVLYDRLVRRTKQ